MVAIGALEHHHYCPRLARIRSWSTALNPLQTARLLRVILPPTTLNMRLIHLPRVELPSTIRDIIQLVPLPRVGIHHTIRL